MASIRLTSQAAEGNLQVTFWPKITHSIARRAKNVVEPTPSDFRKLKKEIAKARRIYETRFRDLSHKVFAHLELHGEAEVSLVTKSANINELKRLLITLSSIHNTLVNMYLNGHQPVVQKLRYSVKPPKDQKENKRLHERIFDQTEQVLIKYSNQSEESRKRILHSPEKGSITRKSKNTPKSNSRER